MSVEVNFRGVGLFTTVERNGARVLDEYLLPDTTLAGSTGLPVHFARLVILDATGNVVSRHNLTGTTVHIADAFGGECVLQSSFDRVQDFAKAMAATSREIATKALVASTAEMTPSGIGANSAKLRREAMIAAEIENESSIELTVLERTKSRYTDPHGTPLPERVTSIAHVSGGALSAHEQAGLPWRRADDDGRPLGDRDLPASPAAIVSWRSSSPVATISIGVEGRVTTSILLDANHPKAYLYHYDDEWASVAQLSGFDESRPVPNDIEGDIADRDFKWLYSMTTIDPETDLESLKAPFIVKGDLDARRGRNPGSSAGCFGAFYQR